MLSKADNSHVEEIAKPPRSPYTSAERNVEDNLSYILKLSSDDLNTYAVALAKEETESLSETICSCYGDSEEEQNTESKSIEPLLYDYTPSEETELNIQTNHIVVDDHVSCCSKDIDNTSSVQISAESRDNVAARAKKTSRFSAFKACFGRK